MKGLGFPGLGSFWPRIPSWAPPPRAVDLASDRSSSNLLITQDSMVLVSAPYHPQLGHRGLAMWLYKDIFKTIFLGLLYGQPLRFTAIPLLLHFWVRFSMWWKISFLLVVQQRGSKPWRPPYCSVKSRPRILGEGWVGLLGADAEPGGHGSRGFRYNSGSPKVGSLAWKLRFLRHSLVIPSDWSCLGAMSLGILYLKAGAQ